MDAMIDHRRVDLTGQTAVVTGASSGLGYRFALVLAAAGARVAVVARRRSRLEDVKAEIQAMGATACAVEADLAEPDGAAAVMAAAEEALGPVSILVNNAGTSVTRPTVELSEAEIDLMLGVNLRAPLLLSRAFAQRRIARGEPGRIVNVSSIGAFVHTGAVPSAAYSITKAAVTRMTEVHAIEWASHGINVNAIAPGMFRTEMLERAYGVQIARMAAKTRRNRIGEPHQLDSTLLYLVDPASEFVTGVCIKVDDAQMPR